MRVESAVVERLNIMSGNREIEELHRVTTKRRMLEAFESRPEVLEVF